MAGILIFMAVSDSVVVSDLWLRGSRLNPGCAPDSGIKKWIELHFEYYAGLSGTPVFGKTPATSQGTQAQQKTAGSRRFGDR